MPAPFGIRACDYHIVIAISFQHNDSLSSRLSKFLLLKSRAYTKTPKLVLKILTDLPPLGLGTARIAENSLVTKLRISTDNFFEHLSCPEIFNSFFLGGD